jgi:preprotein translocase subunit SecY
MQPPWGYWFTDLGEDAMTFARDVTLPRRLAVTVAALAAYYVGSYIALPGLDTNALARLSEASQLSRVSILSLGITPLLSTLILAEIIKLLAPRVGAWEAKSVRNRERLDAIVIGVSLLLALIQAGGFASALEDVPGLVSEPDSSFRMVAIATLVAGTAIAIGLIRLIDSAGLGYGFWLLFLAPVFIELPRAIAVLADLHGQGGLGAEQITIGLAYTAVSVAAIASIVLAARGSPATVSTSVWTPFVVTTAITPALFIPAFIATLDAGAAIDFATPGNPVWYLALVAGVVLTVWLHARSFRIAGEATPVPVLPVALAVAAILVADPLLEVMFGVLLPIGSTQLIVAAAVVTALLIRWGFIGKGSADPDPAES